MDRRPSPGSHVGCLMDSPPGCHTALQNSTCPATTTHSHPDLSRLHSLSTGLARKLGSPQYLLLPRLCSVEPCLPDSRSPALPPQPSLLRTSAPPAGDRRSLSHLLPPFGSFRFLPAFGTTPKDKIQTQLGIRALWSRIPTSLPHSGVVTSPEVPPTLQQPQPRFPVSEHAGPHLHLCTGCSCCQPSPFSPPPPPPSKLHCNRYLGVCSEPADSAWQSWHGRRASPSGTAPIFSCVFLTASFT